MRTLRLRFRWRGRVNPLEDPDVGRERAGHILKAIFGRVLSFARSKSRFVPQLELFVGCSQIAWDRKTSKRAFCHVFHRPGRVCAAPELITVPINYILGVMIHEIGHVLALKTWGRSSERDADIAVLKFLGINLEYRSDLVLEWVSNRVVEQVLRGSR